MNCRLPERREQVLLCCLHICEVALATSLSATGRKAQNRAGFKLFSFSPQRFRHPFMEKSGDSGSCELWSRGSLHYSEMLAVPQSLWKLLGALGSFKAKLFIFGDHIEHWLFLGMLWGCRHGLWLGWAGSHPATLFSSSHLTAVSSPLRPSGG